VDVLQDMPRRKAWAISKIRSGGFLVSAARTALKSFAVLDPGSSTSLSPVRPVSIERSAFCSDSWKVRPIAIASPTDFIAW
jgi:hypothetical protein